MNIKTLAAKTAKDTLSIQEIASIATQDKGDRDVLINIMVKAVNDGELESADPDKAKVGWRQVDIGDLGLADFFDNGSSAPIHKTHLKAWLSRMGEQPNQPLAAWLGTDSSDCVESAVTAHQAPRKPKTRKTNLIRAIESAIENIGHKPSLDALWQYFDDSRDETGFVIEVTESKILWRNTKGDLQDTKKVSVRNTLSKIKP